MKYGNYYIGFFTLLLIGCKTTADPVYHSYIQDHRMTYKAHFDEEESSPIKGADLEMMQFYPANRAYNILAEFIKFDDPEEIEISTFSGIQKQFYVYGSLNFKVLNKNKELQVYRSFYSMKIPEYEDYLFVPYKDLTNGDDTYGGGRYIDIKIGDIRNGKVVLDFNKSYNPYCAYSDGYNCPIPPIENHLDIEILAGEKMYVGTKRKRSH